MFAGEKSTFATAFSVPGIDQCAPSDSKEDLPARGVSRRPSFVSTQFTHILKLVTTVSSTFLLRNGLFTSSLGWKFSIVRSTWFGNHTPRLATDLLYMSRIMLVPLYCCLVETSNTVLFFISAIIRHPQHHHKLRHRFLPRLQLQRFFQDHLHCSRLPLQPSLIP